MKIKHWQGYGTVTAQKISKTEKNGVTTLSIRVSGNHECGLVRKDKYDVANWLIKRFDKNFTDYRNIISLAVDTGYDLSKQEETCYYTVTYNTPKGE